MQNRHVVDFSAHIAKILNTPDPDGWVRVQPFRLWTRLSRTLAHSRDGEYRRRVVGAHLMGLGDDRDSAEEAAWRWLEAVLKRPLKIKAGLPAHQAHLLLESLIRRAPGAEAAALRRNGASGGPAAPLPESLGDLALRLARAVGASEAKEEPLRLEIGAASLPVPADLSVWGALELAPSPMRLLTRTAEKDAFVHLMIRAVENANVAWGRAVAMGLSPQDHDLSTNQIKTIQAFLNAAGGRWPKPERPAMEAAWGRCPVTNFHNLEDFLNAPVGRDLFSAPMTPVLLAFDEERDSDPPAMEDPPLDEAFLREALDLLLEEGLLEPLDGRILRALLDGATLKDIWKTPWAQSAFPAFESFRRHTDMLDDKIIQAVALLNGDETSGDS